jgi:hypothetical protein
MTNCEAGTARPVMGACRQRLPDSAETNQMAEQAGGRKLIPLGKPARDTGDSK